MIKEAGYLVIVLLGIPVGIFFGRLCKEEIVVWSGRLKWISIISFVIGIIVWFMNFEYRIPVVVTLLFVIVNNLTIVWRSKSFLRKKK